MKQITQLILVQLKEFIREPEALFWTFVFPIMMAWGLGLAFTQKPDVVRWVAIADMKSDNTKIINWLKENTKPAHFSNGEKGYQIEIKDEKLGNTTFKLIPTTWNNSILALKKSDISLIISEKEGKINYHFDPANSESQLTYLTLSVLLEHKVLPQQTAVIQPLTKIGTRYIDALIPGLLALGVMNSCFWGIAYSLIDKRSKKILRLMVATPMRKSYFFVAQLFSRFLLSALESFVLVFFSYFLFDIRIEGSWVALLAVFLSGNFLFMGVAVLLASRTANTQVANGLINVISMPTVLVSGIFFSYHNFPEKVLPFIKLSPLTMFADSLRSVFIEGAGLQLVGWSCGVMSLIGLLTLVVGIRIYKWY
jgi:ABC-2 type transport system permease protein